MNYRNIDAMNQSLLKKILIHPQEFVREKERMSQPEDPSKIAPWFVFGTLVDHMLTETTDVEDKFYIQKTKTPSEAIAAIVDGVFEESTVLDDSASDVILKHCNFIGYQSRWKDETRVAKVIEQGTEYYKSLAEAKGKIVIAQDDYYRAVVCKASLLDDEYTSRWLKPDEDSEVIMKVVLEWKFQGIKFKAELDGVHINHETKIITPIDIKTMSKPIQSFAYNFWSYRYDLQGAFYESGLRKSTFIDDHNLLNYEVAPMLFLVAESNNTNKPMVFSNAAARTIGATGGERNGREYEGFTQAIERLKFHTDTNQWDYPQEYYEADGEMLIV